MDRHLNGDAPASFAQRRFWFLSELAPAPSAYDIVAGMPVRGPLDLARLHDALADLVARHAVLSTVLPLVDGEPVQRRFAAAPPALLHHTADPRVRADAVREMTDALARCTGDLATGPLLRAGVITFAPEEHVLILRIHHAIADGASVVILSRELAALYTARHLGAPAALPPVTATYLDFTRAEHQAARDATPAAVAHFREALREASCSLDLPTDVPRRARPSLEGARVAHLCRRVDVDALRAAARRHRATPFVVALSATALVLHRWADASDLVVGTVVSNRDLAGSHATVGDFTNYLPLRIRVDAAQRGDAFVDHVRSTVRGALAHRLCPYERILHGVRPGGDAGSRLYDVGFIWHGNAPKDELPMGDAVAGPVDLLDDHTAELDLTFEAGITAQGLVLHCEYRTELFAPETIALVLARLEEAIARLVESPAATVAELTAITDAEARIQLVEWNRTAVPYDLSQPLHAHVRAQIARTPDAPAVTYEAETISYRELGERVSGVAARLRAHGVGAETRVGVLAERSIAMMVGLLAVLEAGAAYVPLDPELPRERLDGMLADAALTALLVQDAFAHLADGCGVARVRLDEAAAGSTATAVEAPSPGTPAYVLYTSGSTGRPKGVVVEHRAVVNRLLWMQDAFGLDSSDVVLQKTPFGFDVSVWELFWPLMTGARLVFARPGGHRDAAYLADLMRREGVTTVHFVPSMLRVFLEEPDATGLPRLRRVIASGEAMTPELERAYFARLDAPLHNLYGPTEAAIDVTAWECRRGEHGDRTPIGRPIANVQLFVLDAQQRPMPIGARGELCIGGVALARGYLGQPELTARAFVPSPFAAGERLYRTGDVVRYRHDGVLEYLGRNDGQIKIRGVRIELGEIEAVLEAHEGVTAAVADLRGPPHDPRVLAWVVARSDVDEAALRRHAARRLPDAAVPARIVRVDRLPLGPTGKVDRKSLPMPDAPVDPQAPAVPPRGPTEAAIADVWRDVLGDTVLGVHDNFFALGGHSLSATRIVARLRAQFGVELSLRQILDTPTIAELAAGIDVLRGRAGIQHDGEHEEGDL